MNRWAGWITAVILTSSIPVSAGPVKKQVEGQFLTESTLSWFEHSLVIPTNDYDDSDWSEILARYGWVALGRPLPEAARERTNARANSERPSKAIVFGGDMGPAKRAICVIISQMNDQLIARIKTQATIEALDARIRVLEGKLRQ